MTIKIIKECSCERDIYELTYYPRVGFKPKPKLQIGTILKVDDIWSNLYGRYYRCTTSEGVYDINIANAIIPENE